MFPKMGTSCPLRKEDSGVDRVGTPCACPTAFQQLLEKVRGKISDLLREVFALTEETEYVHKCRDWSVL
jgi:hypothetical protein